MVTPAEGPSLPTAPAGKWIWTSVRSRRSIPSSDVRKYYITVKKRDKQAVSQFLVLVNSMGTDRKLLLLETSISGNCYIVFIFAMCSSRKNPYPPWRATEIPRGWGWLTMEIPGGLGSKGKVCSVGGELWLFSGTAQLLLVPLINYSHAKSSQHQSKWENQGQIQMFK